MKSFVKNSRSFLSHHIISRVGNILFYHTISYQTDPKFGFIFVASYHINSWYDKYPLLRGVCLFRTSFNPTRGRIITTRLRVESTQGLVKWRSRARGDSEIEEGFLENWKNERQQYWYLRWDRWFVVVVNFGSISFVIAGEEFVWKVGPHY